MSAHTLRQAVTLDWAPDGLRVELEVAAAEHEGSLVPTPRRGGGTRVLRAWLVADRTIEAAQVEESIHRLEPTTRSLVVDADSRRWSGLRTALGDPTGAALSLARSGVVEVHCKLDATLGLSEHTGWRLTESSLRIVRRLREERTGRRQSLDTRATDIADQIERELPMLAAALRQRSSRQRTRELLTCCAEDLLEGRRHDGPRAFSQHHFADTKSHDDVVDALTRSGCEPQVADLLGLRRAAYLGLGGAIALGDVDVRALAPLIMVPAANLACRPLALAATVVAVENRQSAEALAVQYAHCAVLCTEGHLGPAERDAVGHLLSTAERIVVITDADLGGVRIAEGVIGCCPDPAALELVDVGEAVGAEVGADFGLVSRTGLQAAADGPAGVLARACLRRGGRVEQEGVTLTAVRALNLS